MLTFNRVNLKISDFLRWNNDKQLIIQPKFQRRSVWKEDARSYLIDTILRDYPMPKIYLRKIVSPETNLMAYEVVDGQQRLKAILDFLKGDLIIRKNHYPTLGNKTFDELPNPVQRRFLQYIISTEVMEEATDPEVWAMFERLNTYTVTLTKQERLNAKYFGYFKQTCYKLAAEQSALDSWRDMRVFTNYQIARMTEVEVTSDVLVALIDGISDITYIRKAYENYDNEFPKQEFAIRTFHKSLSFIDSELQETVRHTRFRNKVWFYSLMVAVIDALVGIKSGYGQRPLRAKEEVRERMLALDLALAPTPIQLPPSLASLHDALSRRTSHVRPRQIRHEYFYGMLTLSESSWQEKLGQNLPQRSTKASDAE